MAEKEAESNQSKIANSVIHERCLCSCNSETCKSSTKISNLCISSSMNGSIFVGNEEGGKIFDEEFKTHKDINITAKNDTCIPSCLFSRKDPHILYFTSGPQLYRYDSRENKSLMCYLPNEDEINDLDLSNDELHIAAADDSGEIRVFDIRKKEPFKVLRKKHDNICSSVRFNSLKKTQLISGGLDCNLIVWDYQKLRALRVINTQQYVTKLQDSSAPICNPPMVNSLCLNSTGKFLACGLGNGLLQLFMFNARQNVEHNGFLSKHSSLGVSSVRFETINNNDMLIAGGNDAVVTIWKLNDTYNAKTNNPSDLAYLCDTVSFETKINCVTTHKTSSSTLLCIADQTSCIKRIKLSN